MIDFLRNKFAGVVVPAWLKWLVLALIAVALVASIYAYGQQQFGRGEKSAHAAWQARQIKELIDANATIIKLQRQAREDERKHQANLSELDKRYQEKQAHEAVKTQSMLRDLRNGAVSMRYPTTASKQASGGATSAVKPSASLGDGAETSELPPAIAADIYSEAARADEITEQLGACQQVVIEDRRVCGVANE